MVDTRKTILVIENEIVLAEELINHLSMLDYVTLLATSRDMAAKTLASHAEPDCVVMDWYMPGMTVPDFMELLRSRHPALTVLAVSSAPVSQTALKLKVDRFLAKPFTLDELSAAISFCLDQSRKRRESGI